jgi:hypothetical protein
MIGYWLMEQKLATKQNLSFKVGKRHKICLSKFVKGTKDVFHFWIVTIFTVNKKMKEVCCSINQF